MVNKLWKLVSVVLMVSILATACTNTPSSEDEGDLIVQAESNSVLNLGINSVDTLNPILSKSVSVRECMQLIFEPLYSFDEGFNPISVIAESCTPSADATSYTLKLKNGIMWHDNTELTAYDVQHTINLINDNDSYYKSLITPINDVIYLDKYTLVLRLLRPVPNFTALLSFPIVQQKATPDVVNYMPIGTGPYKYDKKVSSDKIQLIPNENWRGTLATINKVHLNVVKDNEALINSYNANSISALSSNVMDLRKNTPRGDNNISDYTSNNLVFLGINNSKSEFSSTNTRQALSILVDRNDIVTTEVFSRAVPVNIPINPSSWYYPKNNSDENGMDYIKELLALDGWKQNEDGNFVKEYEETEDESKFLVADIIVNSENEEKVRIATKIANSFSSFGIETTVTKIPFEEYKQRVSDKNYSLFIGEINLPYNMDLHSLLVEDDNYFAFSSDEMDSVIRRIGISKTTEEVKTAFGEFQTNFLTSTPFVPLFFRKESVIFDKNVSGISVPTMFASFRNPENWYISKTKAAENIIE